MKKYILLALLPCAMQHAAYGADEDVSTQDMDTIADINLNNQFNKVMMPYMMKAQKSMKSNVKLQFDDIIQGLVLFAGKARNNKIVAIAHLQEMQAALEKYRSLQYPSKWAAWFGPDSLIVVEKIDPALNKIDYVLESLGAASLDSHYGMLLNPVTLAFAVAASVAAVTAIRFALQHKILVLENRIDATIVKEIYGVNGSRFANVSDANILMQYAMKNSQFIKPVLTKYSILSSDQKIQLLEKLSYTKDQFIVDITSLTAGIDPLDVELARNSLNERTNLQWLFGKTPLWNFANDSEANINEKKAALLVHYEIRNDDNKKAFRLTDDQILQLCKEIRAAQQATPPAAYSYGFNLPFPSWMKATNSDKVPAAPAQPVQPATPAPMPAAPAQPATSDAATAQPATPAPIPASDELDESGQQKSYYADFNRRPKDQRRPRGPRQVAQ